MIYLRDEHGQQRNVEAVTEDEKGIRTVWFYNSYMRSVSIKENNNGVFMYRGTEWELKGYDENGL